MKRSKRRRIKRGELVKFVFSVFSQWYERTSVDSIYDIRIPVAELRRRLSESYDSTYQNDWWILTQIHRYERETGSQLFERVDDGDDPDSIVLAIYRGIDGFHQSHHLLANQKIRIAAGVLDLIRNTEREGPEPISLYLGSGSIPATVADVLMHKIVDHGGAYRVFSHNLAVQEKILTASHPPESIDFYSVGGRVDWAKYIILTDNVETLTALPVDYVVQSTNTISDGTLYVSDPHEAAVKKAILYDLPGTKILTVMKDEFTRSSEGKQRYGRLCDYDYIVTIPAKNGTTRLADRFLADRTDRFQQLISHWSYTVYRTMHEEVRTVPPQAAVSRHFAESLVSTC